jgi:thiol-disulfide isomerase/thioredoxin
MHLGKKVEMETNMNKKSIYKYVLMWLNSIETPMGEVKEMKEMPWNYVKYSKDLIGKNEKTVLFFHANWCPSCRAADKNIKSELESISKWVSILMTDYDKNKDLRKKYWVTSQHTFVQVDKDWNLIKKWLGSNTVEEINNNLQ